MGDQMSNYQQYEQMKREWILAHPSATSHEYQVAMRRIAEKCGV